MEDTGDSKQDAPRHLSKARVIGMLFGKDKKLVKEDNNVSDFLHVPSDKLQMTGAAPPPKLPKIDTAQASRWPTAAEINRLRDTSRGRSASPRRPKKGLTVRFTDIKPEIIGEGGDEAESPTIAISERKRSNSHPPTIQQHIKSQELATDAQHEHASQVSKGFRPSPLPRRLTGHSSIPNAGSSQVIGALGNETSRSDSFTARVQADMRAAEGQAFKLGSRSSESPGNESSAVHIGQSSSPNPIPAPATTRPLTQRHAHQRLSPELPRPYSTEGRSSVEIAQQQASTAKPSDVDAGNDFLSRVQHLFKLFQLSAESISPINLSPFNSWVRAASWWFLKGKYNAEMAIKTHPPEAQRSFNGLLQQAHADIAKSLWITKYVIPRHPEFLARGGGDATALIAGSKKTGDFYFADLLERCKELTVCVESLAVYLQRHGALPPPPDEALLPQGLDNTVWITYPSVTPTLANLVRSNGGGAVAPGEYRSPHNISDIMPLGDTEKQFEYSRMFVDLFILGDSAELQRRRFPCILFVSRVRLRKELKITIFSQDGYVALCVSSEGNLSPTWKDISWQVRTGLIDVKLARGFIARVQCSPNDLKTLWNMYDYTLKVHSSFQPRGDENLLFDKTVKTFQYFDRDRQSRVFPKEPMAYCQVRLLEKNLTEVVSAGARNRHSGFRIAVVTSTTTKTLSGISQDLPASRPIQYGFMRGEGDAPALLLKFDDGMSRSSMVLTFKDPSDRSHLHGIISGGVRRDEVVSAFVPVKDFSMTSLPASETQNSLDVLRSLEWQGVRVINRTPTDAPGVADSFDVPSTHLRVIVDSKNGNLIDRINVGSGDIKIRVQLSTNEMMILREPQKDMTISILESQVSKDMSQNLTEFLHKIAELQTIRKYCFLKIEDLHLFQTAVTGFSVLYDGVAQSFAISRRRTVVSIHKKWDASSARLQILRHNKSVQLAAFFENFSHGECMNFILKATDTYESYNRSGKFCLRIVDAKFALPKGEEEGYEGVDKGFVCLDMPDFASEHEDITITFDSEAGMFI
jgi:hypothetical protein